MIAVKITPHEDGKTCGGCDDLENGECMRFSGEELNLSDDGKRCLRDPLCLAAEKLMRDLVEALKNAKAVMRGEYGIDAEMIDSALAAIEEAGR